MANWSELPEDIIGLFADRLPYFKDFVRFGSVSKSWRSASIQAKTRRKSSDLWLVTAKRENDKISGDEVRSCYSFSSDKVFDLSFPELQGRRCWGTQYGWVITLGLDSEYHLFNPLTKARYSLPHRSTFRTFRNQGDYDDNEHMCSCFPGNFALSSDPSDSGESVIVMAMYGGWAQLAFASPKDKSWTCLKAANNTANDDAIFFNDRFFSISLQGVLRMCEIDATHPEAVDISPPPLLFDNCGTKLYLVEITGELHLIVRRFNYLGDQDYFENHHLETSSFDLYKFDFHGNQWIQVSGFENHSLFVGNNTTFAISTSDYLDFSFKLNCVYFTDDQQVYYENRFCDMGVYDIGIRAITELSHKQSDLPSKFSRPFIFMHSLA